MTEKEQRVPVTVRAVIQRINRRLEKDGQRLKASRFATSYRADIGLYFIVSIKSGRLIETRIILEELARREHALDLWEEIQPKEGEA